MGDKKRNSNKDSDKTKQYKIKPSKKATKGAKTTKKRKKKHKVLKRVILVSFLLIMLAGLTGIGMVAGIFFSDKWTITKEELIANGNTEVYDSDKKLLAVLSVEEGDGNRKVISIDEMGKYTVNAYIAIEDKRFYEHSGVDILRTGKATISYALHKGSDSSVGGGSTITQQLVKNLMRDDADSGSAGVERKIREMSRAYQLEGMLTKPQILEKYLNVIFVGGNNLHGVEYGAQYYFAKSAKDLDLAESAFLAGINHGPNQYNPYGEEVPTEEIAYRTKLVLGYMKEQNRISDNQEEAEKLYNEAIAKVEKGFEFKQGKLEFGNTSYFVSEAVKNVARDLAKEKDISVDAAITMIKSGGYKLYTTQVTSIQNTLIKEMAKDKYIEKTTDTIKDENGKSKKVTYRTNAGMTIIEPSTGKVVAMAGDLQQDNGALTNYAMETSRQTGSSIKPLADLSPGLEEGVITASTVYDDTLTRFPGNPPYEPHNYGRANYGLTTVRKGIERSSNVVNSKIMSNVGVDKAVEYLNEFGLDTYKKGEEGLSLAIGGMAHSSSTLQMAAAYAALANGGEYIEPTFYTKLVDSEGNTVLEPKQEKRRVISEANAYIITTILFDVVNGAEGTANSCAISGMDVACKTGTTDAATDKWLCGYTPYYAAASWYGYGAGTKYSIYGETAKQVWSTVMKSVHKDLKNKRFTKPASVVTAKVCRTSGKAATSNCKNTYTEYFVKGTVPKACDGHVTVKICKTSGKVATQYCPETEEKYYTAKPEKEQNPNWTVLGKAQDKYKVPKDECTVHTEETSKVTVVNVVGKPEADAKTALAGLSIQVIYETHSDQANGVVIRQSLAEGTKVDKGVAIVITVNQLSSSGGSEENTQNPSTNTNTSTNTSTGTNTSTNTSGGNATTNGTTNTTANPNTNTNPNQSTTP